jgi:Transcriptional regulators
MEYFIRHLNRIRRCLNIYRGEMLKGKELAGCHVPYVLKICRTPGILQDQLAKEFYVNKSNVARHLAALEKNNYIYRTPKENDRRTLQVFPTEQAMEILPLVSQTTQEWKATVLEDLSEEERAMFMRILKQVADKAVTLAESGWENI